MFTDYHRFLIMKIMMLQTIKTEMEQELHRLLRYWSTEMLDTDNGGFLGRIDHFGNKYPRAEKGVVLNTRILWTFSAAYRTTKLEEYKQAAGRAYEYIVDKFWDSGNGGLIWSVDYLGSPLNTRKQAYAQGFGVYAFSEYYRATGNDESMGYAQRLFHILENKFYDTKYDGYIEALSKDWSALSDFRLSEKDINSPKSMNTLLHILEPYTNLLRVWDNTELQESISRLLNVFETKIIDAKTGHFKLFFDMDWTSKSSTVSFGHDIEGAWLLNEAAHELGEDSIIKSIQSVALRLVDITLEEGLDIDGSLFNEQDDSHIDTDKHWWPQAEAMVGVWDAYMITKSDKYLAYLNKFWNFIKQNLIDRKTGEWHWRVDKNNKPITTEDRAGFWKCPYHNSRALMEIIERCKAIDASHQTLDNGILT